MKVFVSTSYRYREEASKAMDELRSAGLEATYDWTSKSEFNGNSEGYSEAATCLKGIRDCDVFILINRPNMNGAKVELGYALGKDKVVFLVTDEVDYLRSNLFSWLTGIHHFNSIPQVIKYLEDFKEAPLP